MGRGMGRGMGGGGKGEYWLVELVDTYALVCMLILLSTVHVLVYDVAAIKVTSRTIMYSS